MDRNRHRSGQALMMVTVALFMMLGMMSLAVDLGWGYFRREAAQTAADAAAAAVIRAALATSPGSQTCGASHVWCGSPAGTATNCPATAPTTVSTSFDNGCMLAAANGFTTSGAQTVSIQANTTTSVPTVPGTTVNYWATVRIKENAASFFGTIGGRSSLTSGARATAAITSTGVSTTSACLYLLNTTGTSLQVGNGAHLTTSSCGIYVNSTSNTAQTEAMTVTGGALVTSSSIKIVGGYSTSNGGSISSTPSTGTTAVADPFASLPSPTVPGTCSSGNFTGYQATPYALTAGCYSGLSVGNGMSANLSAGIYIINGGTFSLQGGTTLNGTGVMIYLTNGATVNIANGASVTMSAETTGSYQGILFYQDRTIASPGTSYFAGGANMRLSGSLYLPHALLTIDNGASAQTEAIVAGSVNFQGGATLNQATSSSQTGLPVSTTLVSVIE